MHATWHLSLSTRSANAQEGSRLKASKQRHPGGFSNLRYPALILLSVVIVLAACSSGGPEIPERIILIVVDTLRRDHVSCYGAEITTAEIDALAKKGQIFTNAFSSYHQTQVSMASLFTGRTPSLESGKGKKSIGWTRMTSCGLYRHAAAHGEDRCFPLALPTLAEKMREAGYWTIGITSNALLYDPGSYSRGFDDWVEIEGKWYGGEKPKPFKKYTLPGQAHERNGEAINGAAKGALARRPKGRFFLYAHYMDAHDYFEAGVPYAKGVLEADYWVGRLLAHLEEAGLLEDAVVVLTSDHGERLGERQVVPGTKSHYGNPSFEQLLQVPLIVAPARFDDTSRLVRGDDVFRMLEEIAGIPREGKPDLQPGELFVSESRYITYRKGPWKSFQHRTSDQTILIHLESDPGETTNVAAENPGALEAHLGRTAELSKAFAVSAAPEAGFSELEKARLKSLGYLP
jgi:arylsulfatase A-like enzyme